jgi:hypothetical protein
MHKCLAAFRFVLCYEGKALKWDDFKQAPIIIPKIQVLCSVILKLIIFYLPCTNTISSGTELKET